MTITLNRRADSADIALLLEGTFPYVQGGVSAWVNQVIRAFPQYRFSIAFIGSRREDYDAPCYALPPNVVHFEEHYIHEREAAHNVHASAGDARAFAQVGELHDMLRQAPGSAAIGTLMRELLPMLKEGGRIDEQAFLHSRCAWEFIAQRYEKYCSDPSFTDYFWTVRIMHRPLWQLSRIARHFPPARLYHTVSTGYAGLLGAMLQMHHERPLLVSEHGIYTKERKIDLLQSQWVRDNRSVFEKDISQVAYFQDLWVRFFEAIGRICYDAADDVVALYEGNRLRQVHDGAASAKTHTIANGIALERYTPLRLQRPADAPLVVALIGRVVPIKDIKTFIRAVFIANRHLPGVQGWVIGPQSEDPDYAQECRDLANSLGLQDNFRMLGFQSIDALLPKIGLVALTSISEGLPLVLLEAMAAGVPVVATDVGACRQLVHGLEGADRALGAAGAVVPIASPERVADAMLDLLTRPEAWRAAQHAGIARVERYYTQKQMLLDYQTLYNKLLGPLAQPQQGAS